MVITRCVHERILTLPAGQQAAPWVATCVVCGHDLAGYASGSFQLPAAFDGSTITIEVSNDGVTPTDCPINEGGVNPVLVTPGGSYSLPPETCKFHYFRLRSSAAETADRAIRVRLVS